MTEKQFTYDSKTVSILKDGEIWLDGNVDTACNHSEICEELNELAEENQHMKFFINNLEAQRDEFYRGARENAKMNGKLQKEIDALHEENTYLKLELDTHKHPLWSTREAERKVSELIELLSDEVKKNGELLEENNLLRIENKRLLEHKELEE